MKSPRSSGRPKRPRLLSLRRVVGDSMLPTLKPGQIIVGLYRPWPKTGDLLIVQYKDKMLVKRLAKMSSDKLYIVGDNTASSSDSRTFGWLPKDSYIATVI